MIYITSGYAPATPLTHARICYQSHILDGQASLSASSSDADFPLSAIENPLTYDRWKPTSVPAYITIDLGGIILPVNYVGIAAHELAGFTVKIQSSSDGVTWTDRSSAVTPTDNSAMLFLFSSLQVQYWRVYITGTGIPSIAVLYIGTSLDMERTLYAGHSPVTLSRVTTIDPVSSEGGQFLGRTTIRRGYKGSAEFKNLSSSFYRNSFDPFVQAARSYPFFFAWRPSVFTSDVAYCWTTDDITPSNNGTRALMDVSFDMVGYDGSN